MHNFMLRVEGMYMCIILCSVLQNCQHVRINYVIIIGVCQHNFIYAYMV